MRKYYPAVIDREGDLYGITFPDFPGCVSSAANADEVCKAGIEALTGHVALMAEDGDIISEPSSLEDIVHDDDEDIVTVVLVEIPIPGRKKRINVTLDENLISEIDRHAPNRSRFLEDAARGVLAALG